MSLKKTFYTFVDVVRPIYISVFVDVEMFGILPEWTVFLVVIRFVHWLKSIVLTIIEKMK